MPRTKKPVIAVNYETGEKRKYDGMYEAAGEIGVKTTSVINAIATGCLLKGWRFYDTPDNIRKKIRQMELDIEMLEG